VDLGAEALRLTRRPAALPFSGKRLGLHASRFPRGVSRMDCIFCAIVAGRAPAHRVWEDAAHVAFLDIRPIAAGHVLLVPRAHVPWIEELSPDAHAALFAAVRRLAPAVATAARAPHTGLAVEGYGVSHVHVHLVPIARLGDLDPCRQQAASPEALAEAASRVRLAIAAAAG
jgi:histidine triad (HIT) family protein